MRLTLMRSGPVRAWTRAAATLAAVLLACGPVRADGRCDLNEVIGYQIVFSKAVEGYIQNGVRKKGYEGCEADRVLVFTDNTGVRCRGLALRKLEGFPRSYLFVNNKGDMKLCVEGELFDVMSTN